MSSAKPSKKPLILIAAGGTGGHVFPALAVAVQLRSDNVEVMWVGTKAGIESRLVPEHNFPITFIRVVGVRGKSLAYRITAPFLLLIAVLKIWRLLRNRQVQCVLCMGGYVSAAAGIAAFLAGKPLLLQEQNALPGSTNKLLAPLANKIFTGFPDVFATKSKAIFSGNPLRENVLAVAAPEDRFNSSQTVLQVLVVGGSLGAAVFNQLLPKAFAKLQATQGFVGAFEVTHQSGKKDAVSVAESYQQAGVAANVHAFIDDMAAAYSKADLVIARAGALTVAEIAAIGVASILVPYPHAIDNHQAANAQWLVDAGAAICISQSQFGVDQLVSVLVERLQSRAALLADAQRARAASRRDATAIIADACREYACA